MPGNKQKVKNKKLTLEELKEFAESKCGNIAGQLDRYTSAEYKWFARQAECILPETQLIEYKRFLDDQSEEIKTAIQLISQKKPPSTLNTDLIYHFFSTTYKAYEKASSNRQIILQKLAGMSSTDNTFPPIREYPSISSTKFDFSEFISNLQEKLNISPVEPKQVQYQEIKNDLSNKLDTIEHIINQALYKVKKLSQEKVIKIESKTVSIVETEEIINTNTDNTQHQDSPEITISESQEFDPQTSENKTPENEIPENESQEFDPQTSENESQEINPQTSEDKTQEDESQEFDLQTSEDKMQKDEIQALREQLKDYEEIVQAFTKQYDEKEMPNVAAEDANIASNIQFKKLEEYSKKLEAINQTSDHKIQNLEKQLKEQQEYIEQIKQENHLAKEAEYFTDFQNYLSEAKRTALEAKIQELETKIQALNNTNAVLQQKDLNYHFTMTLYIQELNLYIQELNKYRPPNQQLQEKTPHLTKQGNQPQPYPQQQPTPQSPNLLSGVINSGHMIPCQELNKSHNIPQTPTIHYTQPSSGGVNKNLPQYLKELEKKIQDLQGENKAHIAAYNAFRELNQELEAQNAKLQAENHEYFNINQGLVAYTKKLQAGNHESFNINQALVAHNEKLQAGNSQYLNLNQELEAQNAKLQAENRQSLDSETNDQLLFQMSEHFLNVKKDLKNKLSDSEKNYQKLLVKYHHFMQEAGFLANQNHNYCFTNAELVTANTALDQRSEEVQRVNAILLREKEELEENYRKLEEELKKIIATNETLLRKTQALEKENNALRADNDALITDNDALRADNDDLRAENDELIAENDELIADNDELRAENDELIEKLIPQQATQEPQATQEQYIQTLEALTEKPTEQKEYIPRLEQENPQNSETDNREYDDQNSELSYEELRAQNARLRVINEDLANKEKKYYVLLQQKEEQITKLQGPAQPITILQNPSKIEKEIPSPIKKGEIQKLPTIREESNTEILENSCNTEQEKPEYEQQLTEKEEQIQELQAQNSRYIRKSKQESRKRRGQNNQIQELKLQQARLTTQLEKEAGSNESLRNKLKEYQDKIQELQSQIENQQAESSQDVHTQYPEQLKEKEKQIQELKSQIESLSTELEKEAGSNESLHNQLTEYQKKIQELNSKIERLYRSDKINSSESIARQLIREKQVLQNQIQALQSQQTGSLQAVYTQYQEHLTAKEEQIQALKISISKLTSNNSNLLTGKRKVTEEKRELQNQIQELQSQLEKQQAESSQDVHTQYQEQLKEKEEQIKNLLKEINNLQKNNKKLQEKNAEIPEKEGQIQALQSQLEKQQAESSQDVHTQYQEQLKEKERQIKNLLKEINNLQKNNKKLQEKNTEIPEKEGQIQALQSQLEEQQTEHERQLQQKDIEHDAFKRKQEEAYRELLNSSREKKKQIAELKQKIQALQSEKNKSTNQQEKIKELEAKIKDLEADLKQKKCAIIKFLEQAQERELAKERNAKQIEEGMRQLKRTFIEYNHEIHEEIYQDVEELLNVLIPSTEEDYPSTIYHALKVESIEAIQQHNLELARQQTQNPDSQPRFQRKDFTGPLKNLLTELEQLEGKQLPSTTIQKMQAMLLALIREKKKILEKRNQENNPSETEEKKAIEQSIIQLEELFKKCTPEAVDQESLNMIRRILTNMIQDTKNVLQQEKKLYIENKRKKHFELFASVVRETFKKLTTEKQILENDCLSLFRRMEISHQVQFTKEEMEKLLEVMQKIFDTHQEDLVINEQFLTIETTRNEHLREKIDHLMEKLFEFLANAEKQPELVQFAQEEMQQMLKTLMEDVGEQFKINRTYQESKKNFIERENQITETMLQSTNEILTVLQKIASEVKQENVGKESQPRYEEIIKALKELYDAVYSQKLSNRNRTHHNAKIMADSQQKNHELMERLSALLGSPEQQSQTGYDTNKVQEMIRLLEELKGHFEFESLMQQRRLQDADNHRTLQTKMLQKICGEIPKYHEEIKSIIETHNVFMQTNMNSINEITGVMQELRTTINSSSSKDRKNLEWKNRMLDKLNSVQKALSDKFAIQKQHLLSLLRFEGKFSPIFSILIDAKELEKQQSEQNKPSFEEEPHEQKVLNILRQSIQQIGTGQMGETSHADQTSLKEESHHEQKVLNILPQSIQQIGTGQMGETSHADQTSLKEESHHEQKVLNILSQSMQQIGTGQMGETSHADQTSLKEESHHEQKVLNILPQSMQHTEEGGQKSAQTVITRTVVQGEFIEDLQELIFKYILSEEENKNAELVLVDRDRQLMAILRQILEHTQLQVQQQEQCRKEVMRKMHQILLEFQMKNNTDALQQYIQEYLLAANQGEIPSEVLLEMRKEREEQFTTLLQLYFQLLLSEKCDAKKYVPQQLEMLCNIECSDEPSDEPSDDPSDIKTSDNKLSILTVEIQVQQLFLEKKAVKLEGQSNHEGTLEDAEQSNHEGAVALAIQSKETTPEKQTAPGTTIVAARSLSRENNILDNNDISNNISDNDIIITGK